MLKVITLLTLGFAVYYWSLTQKLKSIALRAARHRCREAGVQLLDHSVVQYKISLARDGHGNLRVTRHYQFDFTSTGEHRYQGKIIICGKYVTSAELEAYSIN